MDPGGGQGVRDQPHVLADRLRRGDRRRHGAHRRLRRLRRAALGRPAHRLQGLRRDPVGALGHVDPVQRPRRGRSHPPRRRDAREHLPREDHDLERPGDQEAQPEPRPARPEDHAGLPLGQLGHDLQLHRVPLERLRRVQVEGRELDRRELPDGCRRARQRGRRGRRLEDRRRPDIRRRRVLPQQQAHVRRDPEPRRRVCPAGPPRHQAGRLAAPEEGHDPLAAQDRRPAEGRGQAGLPDLDVQLRDRADEREERR